MLLAIKYSLKFFITLSTTNRREIFITHIQIRLKPSAYNKLLVTCTSFYIRRISKPSQFRFISNNEDFFRILRRSGLRHAVPCTKPLACQNQAGN